MREWPACSQAPVTQGGSPGRARARCRSRHHIRVARGEPRAGLREPTHGRNAEPSVPPEGAWDLGAHGDARRSHHLRHGRLRAGRQPLRHVRGRHGRRRRLHRDRPRLLPGHLRHGASHQLPLRAGSQHGTERLLRLHRGAGHGLQLGGGARGHLPRGRGLCRDIPHEPARQDLRGHPAQPQVRHLRGHWPVHHHHRPQELRPRGLQPGHPGLHLLVHR